MEVSMKVSIVTRPGCPRCLLLKDKLRILGVKWSEGTAFPGLVGVEGKELPLVDIDGEYYEYAAAVAKLKEMIREANA